MAQEQEQRAPMQKVVNLKDEAYYSNCTMVETTPFDIAILFGKIRPATNESGERTLVEVYDRQVYLSHLQAKALYDAIGRSLASLSRQRAEAVAAAQAEPQQ
jgi:hypothetical protein